MMQTISFTEPVVRSAARRGVLRMLGALFFVAMALLAISVVFSLIQGDYGLFLGVTATVLGIAVIVPIAAISAHTRVGLEKYRALEGGAATIDLSEGRLRVASKIGSLDMPLSTVKKVWRYPDYWILVANRSILMTVPLHGVPPEIRTEWETELRQAGARLAH